MIGDKKIKINNNEGFSLVEMLVSVAIFTVLITISLSIFQTVTSGQRNAIAVQSVQESMRYALEVMSKELRSAQQDYSDLDHDGVGDTDDCLAGATYDNYNIRFGNTTGRKVYNVSDYGGSLTLYFKDKNDQCVYYYINTDDRLYVDRGGVVLPITPDEIELSNFRVKIDDNAMNEFHDRQAVVTIRLDAKMRDPRNDYTMKLQTSISSRYYE